MSTKQSHAILDFGPDIPVTVSKEARECLARLPSRAVKPVLKALRGWGRNAPLLAARASVFADPEDLDWRELIIDIRLDCETETAMELWDQMEQKVAAAKTFLDAGDRELIDRHLAVHLLWGADDWVADSEV